MDILAWIIIVCFTSFVMLPAIVDSLSSSFMDYKDCWIAGNGTVILLTAFGTFVFGVMWAFGRVVW